MKVLVIPDCHLKPHMFTDAAMLLNGGVAERAVYLGDTPDDWDCQYRIDLYEKTFDALIDFVTRFPNTLLCYGNHDLSYLWYELESGYSPAAENTVHRKISELESALSPDNPIKYIQRVDDVIFSHGGVSQSFVNRYVKPSVQNNIDATLEHINMLGKNEMWCDDSPIWLRPQYEAVKMFMADKLLQVVGHTPMRKIERNRNTISCDVFSTYGDGSPIGTCEFAIIDTKTWDVQGCTV